MPGVLGLLGVMFIGLKLTGHIAWSWWLVLLPFYGGIFIWLAFVFVIFLAAVLGEVNIKTTRKYKWS